MFRESDHTFAICAYGESPYLNACIKSVLSQSVRGNVLIVTSTPNQYISDLAKRYHIPLHYNKNGGSIAKDWNFAIEKAETGLVTITHQDDVYLKYYLESVLIQCNKSMHPLIVFTDYGELRKRQKVVINTNLQIKRVMLLPLRFRKMWACRWIRRRILSLGSPVSCPTVTYVRENIPKDLFEEGFQCNLDWQAWEKISLLRGDFVYCPEILMFHRIHEESTTTKIIEKSGRRDEDLKMFLKFWPRPVATAINILYNKATKSNEV